MKRTLRQKLSLLMVFAIMLSVLMGCTTGTNNIEDSSDSSVESILEGKWYDEYNRYVELKPYGFYNYNGTSTNGKWTQIDSSTLEFTNVGIMDSTVEVDLVTDSYGMHFNMGGTDYYKGEYPSEFNSSSNTQSSAADGNSQSESSEFALIELDPFDGATFEVTGVSPYLTLTVNNSGCQSEVQNCVTYTLDKEQYANGDTAVITASFMEPNSSGNYTLAETEKTYSIKDQPEYITSLDGIDLTTLESELDDYMTAKTSESIDTNYLFNIGAHDGVTSVNYISVDKIELQEKYLISLKKNKIENNDKFFNSINYIYQISTTTGLPEIGYSPKDSKIYVNVSAYNVVKYPDGSLKWGLEDPDSYQFEYQSSDKGVNNLVTTTITVLSDNYNITKIDIGNKNSKPQQ